MSPRRKVAIVPSAPKNAHPDSWAGLEGGFTGISPDGTGPQGQIGRRMSRNIVQARSLTFAYLQRTGDGQRGRAAGADRLGKGARRRNSEWDNRHGRLPIGGAVLSDVASIRL